MNSSFERYQQLWEKSVPWLSLISGLASAALMDRTPERAPKALMGIVLGWLTLVILMLLTHRRPAWLQQKPAWVIALLDISSRMAAAAPIQFALFFTAPFYVQACANTLGHYLFLALLFFLSVLSLWDPIFEQLLCHRILGRAIQAFASFIGMNAILPILGVSNTASLKMASLLTVSFLILTESLSPPHIRRGKSLLAACGVSVVLLILLSLGFIRHTIPPAPMALKAMTMGTHVIEKNIQNASKTFHHSQKLTCFSLIQAPLGLHDNLYHVWSFNGFEQDRIALNIAGGRQEGFRTWSSKEHFRDNMLGHWTCTVETESGQILGHISFERI